MPRYQQVIRQWQLLRLLERRPAGRTVPGLARDLDTTERTVYRDLAALGEAGFPLYKETSDGDHRWRLTDAHNRRGVPVALSEILALRAARGALSTLRESGLTLALQSLIHKLDTLLAPKMRAFARDLDQVVVADPFGRVPPPPPPAIMGVIEVASTEKRTVTITYGDNKGRVTHRDVDPYRLWLHRGCFYLVAWCHRRDDIRTFHTARIRRAVLTDRTFEPKNDFDFEQFALRPFRMMTEGQRHEVHIRFAPEVATYVKERTWHPTETKRDRPDGGVDLRMTVDGLTELTSTILSFGTAARAMAPQELVDRVKGKLKGALAAYDDQPRGHDR